MPVNLAPFDAADFLKDEKTIAEYLNACMETGDPDVMLNALGATARARGMADLADRAGVNRESLYKALMPGAKPRYDTIFKVVKALGIDMVFKVPPSTKTKVSRTVAKKPVERTPVAGARTKAGVEQRATAKR